MNNNSISMLYQLIIINNLIYVNIINNYFQQIRLTMQSLESAIYRASARHPMCPKNPAPQYQPMEGKKRN